MLFLARSALRHSDPSRLRGIFVPIKHSFCILVLSARLLTVHDVRQIIVIEVFELRG